MPLLALPLELFQAIIDEVTCVRPEQSPKNDKEAKLRVRLRFVCKLFATEVINSLFRTKFLDHHFSGRWGHYESRYRERKNIYPHFIDSYVSHRIRNGPYDDFPFMVHIRDIASTLHSQDSTNDKTLNYYLNTLCDLLIRNRRLSILFNKSTIQCPRRDSTRRPQTYNLITAAVLFNIPTIVQQQLEHTIEPPDLATVFGSALEIAIDASNHEMLKLIPFFRDTALSYAAETGNIPTFHFLLDFCSKTEINMSDPKYRPIRDLMPLFHTPSIQLWNTILEIRKQNNYGRLFHPIPFLHRAAEKGWTEMVQYILSLEAIDETHACRNDTRALFLASKNGHTDVVRILLKHCIQKEEVLCNASGQIVPDAGLDIECVPAAAAGGHLEVVKMLLESGQHAGNGVEAAAARGHLDVVELLLKYDADTTESVIAATSGGHRKIVQLLLDHGAETDESLVIASAYGFEDIVRLLLKHDTDTTRALAIAKENGSHGIVKLLSDHGAKRD